MSVSFMPLMTNLLIRSFMTAGTTLLCVGCASTTELSTDSGIGKLYYVASKSPGDKLTHAIYADTMLRAARIAQAHGKAYFLMYDSLDNAAQNVAAQMPRAGVLNGQVVVSAFVLPLDQPVPEARTTAAALAEFGVGSRAGASR